MLNQLAAARSSLAHVGPTYSLHFWISRRVTWSWTCVLVTLQSRGFVLAVVRMARRTTVSRVRGDYFQDGRAPTGTTTIFKRGEQTR